MSDNKFTWDKVKRWAKKQKDEFVDFLEMPGEILKGERVPTYADALKFSGNLVGANAAIPIKSPANTLNFMRYVGSKKGVRYTKNLLSEPLKGSFIEPFAGSAGASVTLAKKGLINKSILAESNPVMRNILAEVRDNPVKAIADFSKIARRLEGPPLTARDSEFIGNLYRTKAPNLTPGEHIAISNYTRLYRPGQAPRVGIGGKYATPKSIIEQIAAISPRLKKGKIYSSWEKAIERAGADDFLFVDPPYYNTAGYIDKFGANEQLKLAEAIKSSKAPGIIFNSPKGAEEFYDFLDWTPTGGLSGKEVAARFNP